MGLSGQSSKASYYTELFDRRSLNTLEVIENVMLEFESGLTESNFATILESLLDRPWIIELVLSGTSGIALSILCTSPSLQA